MKTILCAHVRLFVGDCHMGAILKLKLFFLKSWLSIWLCYVHSAYKIFMIVTSLCYENFYWFVHGHPTFFSSLMLVKQDISFDLHNESDKFLLLTLYLFFGLFQQLLIVFYGICTKLHYYVPNVALINPCIGRLKYFYLRIIKLYLP